MKVDLTWLKGMAFVAENEDRRSIILDTKPSEGGGRGPAPMQVLLMSLAGCTGMDVLYFLKKMRQSVEKFEISVDGERRDEHPRVYTKINIIYVLEGESLNENKVKKAVELSQNKYCSVSEMLKKTAQISYKIVLNGREI